MKNKLFIVVSILVILPLFNNSPLFSIEMNYDVIDIESVTNDNYKGINDSSSLNIDDTKLTDTRNENINDNRLHLIKYFTVNNGQIKNDSVKYYIQSKGLWFTSSGIVLELIESKNSKNSIFEKSNLQLKNQFKSQQENDARKSTVIAFEFENCNKVNPIGKEELPHISNFFYGNDSNKWCTNVPNFQEIIYENIYDNIDLRYYFDDNDLKYDFIIRAGGNPDEIKIKVTGAERILIESDHQVKIETKLNDIFDSNLLIYQENNNQLTIISARFILKDLYTYGFEITDDYNKSLELIIDPFLIYSTYLGGGIGDGAVDIQIDEDQNLYITGGTSSPDFPVKIDSNDTTLNGSGDMFILKLNGKGSSLVYSTFIGGDQNEASTSIAIDSIGNAYITGITNSTNFPITSGAPDKTFIDDEAFVCKLNGNGDILAYSTYIGGLHSDMGYDIVVDSNEIAYITGSTNSDDFPITPDAYDTSLDGSAPDAFIASINKEGTKILHSTFIGAESTDGSVSISFDSQNNICITGKTYSKLFPTTTGAYQESYQISKQHIFISKFNSDLSKLLYSTYFIGFNIWSSKIVTDFENNIYITGITNEIPVTENAYDKSPNGNFDLFISKFDPTLSTLRYSTYFGGNGKEWVFDSIIDSFANIYLVGYTYSPDFPTSVGAFDNSHNGWSDIYTIKLNVTNSRLDYSSFIGTDANESGRGITLDNDGYVYLAGWCQSDFINTSGSFDQNYHGGGMDAFALKLKLNCTPLILDLKLSDPAIYRPRIVEIYSNVTDHGDLEHQLTPYFEYMNQDSFDWFKINNPVYLNNRWCANLSIETNSSLGYYNFRVRFNDTDERWTNWYYLNGSLLVLNNPPQIGYYNLSRSESVIGGIIRFIVNGIDIEDDIIELTFKPEFKHSTETTWESLDYEESMFTGSGYEYTFSLRKTMQYGYYDFRVRINDTDNDYSGWYYLNNSLLINPAPPAILSIYISREEIYRTEIVEIFVNCSDPDTPIGDLSLKLQYKYENEVDWNNLSSDYFGEFWESSVKIKENWMIGHYSFKGMATDWEENTSPWFYLNDSLNILNNKPRMLEISNIPEQMERGSSVSFSVDAKDKENEEDELVIEIEYKLPGSKNWKSEYLSTLDYSENSWQYQFSLPNNAPTGAYSFRARVQDLDNDWSIYFYVNESMRVINHASEVNAFDQSPNEVFRTETITIMAEGSDLETLPQFLNCSMYFLEPNSNTWQELSTQYNDSSGTWNSELVTTKSSVLGNYSFKVFFMDSDGVPSKPWYYNQTVWVKNNLPEISAELDDIEVGKNPKILKLTDFGYDVETSKSNLKWIVDQSTINTKLFHIETENILNQELVIYPVKSKEGKDDITITLTDADNGRIIKKDVTIIVNSISGGGITSPDEDDPVSKLISGDSYWLYIIILIIIIALIILFIFYRRKKQREKEEREKEEGLAQESEETQTESTDESLLPEAESSLPEIEAPEPVPVPVIEEPAEPVPVPMPVEAEKPQLPAGSVDVTQESPKPAQPQPEVSETQIEPVITEENPEDHIEEENNKNNE